MTSFPISVPQFLSCMQIRATKKQMWETKEICELVFTFYIISCAVLKLSLIPPVCLLLVRCRWTMNFFHNLTALHWSTTASQIERCNADWHEEANINSIRANIGNLCLNVWTKRKWMRMVRDNLKTSFSIKLEFRLTLGERNWGRTINK